LSDVHTTRRLTAVPYHFVGDTIASMGSPFNSAGMRRRILQYAVDVQDVCRLHVLQQVETREGNGPAMLTLRVPSRQMLIGA
jgi:hypothetical protein